MTVESETAELMLDMLKHGVRFPSKPDRVDAVRRLIRETLLSQYRDGRRDARALQERLERDLPRP